MYRTVIYSILLSACTTQAAFGQSPFGFTVESAQGSRTVAENSVIQLVATDLGAAATGTLTVAYRGSSIVSVSSIDLIGSSDFSQSVTPSVPASLNPGGTVRVALRYQATTARTATARVVITYREGQLSGTATLNLEGVAPEAAVSYTLQPNGNVEPLAPGGTLKFAATNVNATADAQVAVSNRGSGPLTVTKALVTGGAFQPVGVPLLPATVQPGGEFRFTVRFDPSELGTSRGPMEIGVGSRTLNFNIEGTAIGASFEYDVLRPGGTTRLLPSQQLKFDDTPVGGRATVSIRVRNAGTAPGAISNITTLGTPYQAADLPFLPHTLPVASSVTFTVSFSPTQPGAAIGRLRIGDDLFDLTGLGLGAGFSYSYAAGSGNIPVAAGGSIVFAPADVGNSGSVRFSITNTGTAAASIGSILITGPSIFSVGGQPDLPVSLAPGAQLEFDVHFTPNALGALTGTLRIDTQTFTLSGVGGPPRPLSGYELQATGDPAAAFQQVPITVAIAAPYPLPLVGTLTVSFNSDTLAADPALQFSTGGRTVAFTIPANSTRAVFPNESAQVRLQTGTVSGSVRITAAFATEAGLAIPASAGSPLSFSIPDSAPRLLNVQVTATGANSLTLQVAGFSTNRSASRIEFQFTPTPGSGLSAVPVSVNAEAAFSSWFQNSQSQAFGGLFTATVPFTFSGNAQNAQDLLQLIRSVSATVTSARGTSNSVTVDLR